MDGTASDLYKMAIRAHQDGNLKDAKLYFEQVYSKSPNNGMIVYNYANLLADLGRNRKALEKYNEAIEIDPSIPSIYYNKANCLLDLKLYLEAIETYDVVLDLKPDYIEARFNKAIVLTQLKKFDLAEESYLKIIDFEPNFHLAYYNLACLHSIQLNVDLAIKYLELAILKQDEDVDYKYEAGFDEDFNQIRHLKKFKTLVG
jgi:tetratricopeptide (TPR) repeat protein